MALNLPPGSTALSLGRLGFGGWAMSPEQMRAADAEDRRQAALSSATAIHRGEGEGVSEDLCSNGGCFEDAAFDVIPIGRWAKLPKKKACSGCAKSMAAAFETKAGDGGAMLQKIKKAAKPKKTTSKPARSRRELSKSAPPSAPEPPS